MEDELSRKNVARGYAKRTITRLYQYLEAEEANLLKNHVEELMVRRDRLEKTFNEYEDLCKDILHLNPKDEECVDVVEEKFYKMVTMLNKAIAQRGFAPASSTNSVAQPSVAAKTHLPPVDIQQFNGKFTEYIPFISLFKSMIHNNSSLDVIQKLYYLRSYLIGEPLDLIKNLPITPESYSEALKLLENRYENKYKIVNEHISHLLDLKCITKSTASNLRDFVSCIRQQLAAISIHEPNVIHWSPILLCIFSRKLDSFTTRAYQMDRSSDNKPSLEEFLQYLEKRALALENAEQGHTAGNSRVAALATQGSSCSYYPVAEQSERGGGANEPQLTSCK
ncbi:uncharacterized protein LOC128199212 isoform X1 [Bicyclus anynana]|uniref:Uncharacterized protein LOC128199212 isoform X1 n=1 Tax=Bicyclus anynana TaxID=110368 RepID=A0ABM3LX52_BICAN|nr:uncharacterized protein LOC128199212 isoform X1 [Bicyclus anynana]